MLIIKKRDRYYKGSNYCTGFPSQHFWTADPKKARRFEEGDTYAESLANQTKGKLIPFTDHRLKVSKMSIEDRLKALEAKFGYPGCVPGTSLTRTMNRVERQPHQWTLGLGPMHLAKAFFIGDTVEEALAMAERADPASVEPGYYYADGRF